MRTIQDYWPRTAVTWIIGRTESRLLGDIEEVEFIVFDKNNGWKEFFSLCRKMKARNYDLLLNMQISFRSALAGHLIPAQNVIGFEKKIISGYNPWLKKVKSIPRRRQHVLDGFFEFAYALGIEQRHVRWDIPIPQSAQKFAEQVLAGEKPTLIINPCTSDRFRNWRNWDVHKYAEVADYAYTQHGLLVLLTGSPGEQERKYGQQIVSKAQAKPINLIGQTDLKQLLALINRADLLLSPDSGPVHMATAVGTPAIGLYATSNPERTGPYFYRDLIINKYPQAVQRYLKKSVNEIPWGKRVRDPLAMNLITAEEVKEKIDLAVGKISKMPTSVSGYPSYDA